MLKVRSRRIANVTVLCLEGRIVNGETGSLREAVKSQTDVSTIVLDLARVSTVDAGGLGLLLTLRREAREQGIRFKLMNTSRFVSRIFEITRLDSVFEVIPRTEYAPVTARARSSSRMELAP